MKVKTYCYQCVAGPDLLEVEVEDGVATQVTPNFDAAGIHRGGGKVCVKACGLVQKLYNPNRVRSPMKRTNQKKGRDEDPGSTNVPAFIAYNSSYGVVIGSDEGIANLTNVTVEFCWACDAEL